MIRMLDKLGRLVIPMEFRKANNWNHKDEIEIVENDNELILKKHKSIHCKNCNAIISKNDKYCSNCGKNI